VPELRDQLVALIADCENIEDVALLPSLLAKNVFGGQLLTPS
jgi:hypothetical protein